MIKKTKRIFLALITLLLAIVILNHLYPLNTARLNKPKSTLIYDANHHLLSVKLSSDGFLRMELKKEELTPDIKKIVLGYEDQYFEQHFGVNPLALLRAVWFNVTNQRKIGASTITMQVARMMHHKSRTLSQKLVEMFQAFQLEWYYSKEEILRFYLNNAPYGGNVEGFASASFRYFNLPPSSLSLSQIAYLCAIPKNPNANRPKKGRNINVIKNKLLKRLWDLGLLSKEEYQRAIKEKIEVKINNLPNNIPHLARKIKQEGEVETTIRLGLQKRIEHLLKLEMKRVEPFHIYNASTIVIDNKTMQIVAYVGSNDFYDNKHGGQNDGLRALVSPGSTLKPLVYARALEQGLITPQKRLFDVPLYIDGYKPTNYSKTYEGEVTATEALQRSLNIPAVELDRLLKHHSLYELLEEVNTRSLVHKKPYYGASLVLGGWGVSLKEDAELFAMLANGGVFQRASYLKNLSYPKQSVLMPQACYLISNILADAPRPSFSATWEYLKDMPRIAFKTGTSAHAKDMLTIGYTPNYTVAVWFGNFSGASSKKHNGVYPSGIKIASPTLFKIFKLLGKQSWFREPKGIVTKTICQDAIQLGACKEQIKDQLIEKIPLKNECKTMRAEVLSYLQKQGVIKSIAELKSHPCYNEWKSYKPLITSPIHDKSYSYNKLLPSEFKKSKLECYSFEENQTIYWLIDNNEPIVGTSGKAIYRYLEPKRHTISCLDEGAKVRSIDVFIEEL